MLTSHYGHQLCLVEDSIGLLIDEMNDLAQLYEQNIFKKYDNSQRKEKLFANMIKQLENLKIIQINYIRQGFEKIIDTLIKKKESLIDESTTKYDEEINRTLMMSKQKMIPLKPSSEIKSEVQNLKSMPITERKYDVTLKAQALTNFNSKLTHTIRESKQLLDQLSNVKAHNSMEAEKQFEIRPELNPVTIDTTAAVSYILNMTLSDQSIVKKPDLGKNVQNNEEKASQKMIPPLPNKDQEVPQQNNPLEMSPSKSQNHAFSIENMNIMKHRQSNKPRANDLDKRNPNQISDVKKEVVEKPKEPPRPRKKVVNNKPK